MSIGSLYNLEILLIVILLAKSFYFFFYSEKKLLFNRVLIRENLFFFTIILYYFICKLPAIFGYDYLIGNPDETHWITNANKIKFFEINFNNVDNGSAGIINSVVLAWPILFFQDTTLFTTRLTNSVAILLSIFICFKIFIHLNIEKKLALIFILPLIFFFSGKGYHYGYTTGIFPVLFALYPLLILIKLYSNKMVSKLEIIFSGIFLGLIPFTKLQGIPTGLLVGFLICLKVIQDKNYNFLFLLIILTVFPAIIILTHLIIIDQTDSFFVTHILNNAARSEMFYKPKILSILNYFKGSTINKFSLIIFLLSIVWFILLKKIPSKILFIFALVSMTGIFAVVKPRYLADHHMHFSIFYTYILAGIMFSGILDNKKKDQKNNKFEKFSNIFVKLGFLIFLSLIAFKIDRWSNEPTLKNQRIYKFVYTDMLKNGDVFNFDNLQKKDDAIYVWGWDSINYINSGLKSASKRPWFEHEMLNQFIKKTKVPIQGIYKPDRTAYFIDDTVNDLKKNSPKVFINANVKGRVGWDSLNFKEIQIPEKINFFFENYKLLNQNPNCPKIYFEPEKYRKFKDRYIKPFKIKVSSFEKNFDGSKLDDFEVDRHCDSYWMGLFGKEKIATFYFKETNISNLQVLSNFNNKFTSKKIMVEFYNSKKLIKRRAVKLNNYPKWTSVSVDNDLKLSEIRLILPKKITGLTEVKILR
jgi:hypothetical protein